MSPIRTFSSLLLGAALAGCCPRQPAAETPKIASKPATSTLIICRAAYRGSPADQFQKREMTVGPKDDKKAVEFDDMSISAKYGSGTSFDLPGLKIRVHVDGALDEHIAVLYQIARGDGLANQFGMGPGGHGFTGLNYVNHPTSKAQLQYWCWRAKQ